MGLYHYYLEILPRAFAEKNINIYQNEEKWQNFEGSPWETCQPAETLVRKIASLLPVEKTWDNVREYVSGNQLTSEIRIYHEENYNIRSITLEFSPLEGDFTLLEKYVHLANEYNHILFSRKHFLLIEPEFPLVLSDFKISKAHAFANSPIETILKSANELKRTVENDFFHKH